MTNATNQEPNEIDRRLQGIQSLNPFDNVNSASRKQMFSSHITQNLVTLEPSIKKIQTGMENEYGKYTFSTKMPDNGRILKVIQRYPPNEYLANDFKLSPETIAIYESEEGEIGMVLLERFFSADPHFGFEFKRGPALSKLRTGESISKGEVFLDSPAKTPQGVYKYGTELNIAYMTHPCVSEDGVGISKDILPKLQFKTYERRVVEWGKDVYPLNIYGDDDHYKIFPDIGDYVHPKNHPKGLLMALREYDPGLLAIDQSKSSLQRLDVMFDKTTYAEGAGGRVVDIKIYHQPPNKGDSLCDEMMEQAIRYRDAFLEFRKAIFKEYIALKRQRGDRLRLKKDFHRYIVETMAILNYAVSNDSRGSKSNLQLTYKKNPINEWRAEFVIEYNNVPNVGYKVTDIAGGKGTITEILDPEQMPVAKNGLRADIIMDGASNINRMKFSNLYEQYLNGAKYDLENELKAACGIKPADDKSVYDRKIGSLNKKVLTPILERLNRWHDIVNPKQGEWMRNLSYEAKVKYLIDCLKLYIIDYHPTNTQTQLFDMVEMIEKEFTPTMDVVSFKDKDGNVHTTKNKVRIGSVYMLLLEKTGHDWSSVAVAKTQQNGIISYISPKDKHSTPSKQQATRIFGETEVRVLASYCGGRFTIDQHDRSNNPQVAQEITRNILKAPTPTNVESLVDRNEFPLGYSKPLQIINHFINCAGYKLSYKPFDPDQQVPASTNEFIGKHD